MKIDEITIAPTVTHHQYQGKDLYKQRYYSVQKFHAPGVAPVLDHSGAYHINQTGEALYPQRFNHTFGFYDDRATVCDPSGWYHILLSGDALYSERYRWCGNFQQGCCPVQNTDHQFFHIDLQGNRLYLQNYRYVGDFRDNIAVVQNTEGLYSHINKEGIELHDHWFFDADVYHKGYARAKDSQGWFHIDINGNSIYKDRYAMIEPFYNGIARVQTDTGAMLRIDTSGTLIDKLTEPTNTPFQQLSGDIVGYWRTQTIKAAVDLDIFDYLPASLPKLSEQIHINQLNTERLLRALKELNLVVQHQDIYHLTARAEYLKSDHPLSLHSACIHWAEAHYLAWMKLGEALKQNQATYADAFAKPLFDWLDETPERLALYQKAMTSYARHDYVSLSKKIHVKPNSIIVDAAGGEGTLLTYVLQNNPESKGILLERPALVTEISISPIVSHRMQAMPFDLFSAWPMTADTILLSRVLHDWNDEQCISILENAYSALLPNGRLLIIEFLLDDGAQGGMLDMNMLVITGGKERRLEEMVQLLDKKDFSFVDKKTDGLYHILQFKKDFD